MKYVPSNETIKHRLTSVKAWELPKQESAVAPPEVWTNPDMDPTPIEHQTWTLWTWMAYWATDTINLGTWETASSIVSVGLIWKDAIPIMVVGTFCVAIPMVLNGAIGAKMHVPFSVIVRSSFGYYLAYFCIASRCILAMFWLGIQGANGAQCITVMLTAIWPSLRWLFIIKLFAAPVTAIATMGWIVNKAGGSGELFNLPRTVHGSAYAYKWLSCMSSVTGSWATLACNIPDFSRYARSSKGQYIQLPFLPLIFTLCGVMGIITTSASKVLYGEYLWNPLDIIDKWLDNPGGRAAAFFAALSWYIAQVGTNITANSISAANDMTVLFPKYVNIRRGCIIAAFIGGWAIVPWEILSSAQTFLNFMSGYAVFLAPMAGIMASDYWIIKKQNLDIPGLYNPQGRYRYDYGINWRAALAFLLAVGPNLPGLAYSISPNSTHITSGAKNLYSFDWLYGFVCSIVVYVSLSIFFPAKETMVEHTIYGYDETEGIEYHGDGYGHSDKEFPPGRRESTGNPKSFGNINGLDTIGITRKSADVRRESLASQGGVKRGSTEKV
ncbi:putative ncs1 allantoate transporter [Phaeomoniella chlamydospora]|uniref:Putative ncs1 allantoate transporter n=1 Tax=Phaeomoniella chlamydospora TaxID=158046 RepID=A0A0G2F2K0_PHACM|nr:putative ncs1 allantoate transporter [Phaeomoniella chlamydospora]